MFAATATGRVVSHWDLESGIKTQTPGISRSLESARLTPDTKQLLLHLGNHILVHDTVTGKQLRDFDAGHRIKRCLLSPDASKVVTLASALIVDQLRRSADSEYELFLNEFPEQKTHGKIKLDEFPFAMCFSPDSQLLAVCAYDWSDAGRENYVTIYNTNATRPVARIPVGRNPGTTGA